MLDTDIILEALAINARLTYVDALERHLYKRFEELTNPQIGDLVLENTTMGRQSAFDRIGILRDITREPYDNWDEEEQGEPSPLQQVYYIERVDGSIFRWTNADFIKIFQQDPLLREFKRK